LTATGRFLSLAHLTVLDAAPLELIDAAHAAGFDAIGLRIVAPPAAPPAARVIGSAEMIRSIERRLRETGLSILDVEAVWLLADTDPGGFAAIVETGARLGARFVLTVGNDPEPQRQADNFARLAESARVAGLRAMLEFMPFSQVKTLADARRLVAQAGVPGAGVLVDALHLWRTGGGVADLAALTEGDWGYIQLCDARAEAPSAALLRDEARSDRFYPGDGALDLVSLLRALPEDLPLSIEAPCRAYSALPEIERARICAEHTRRFLQGVTPP
jgi:sugar phosphate isomerase/epimerase